ncbi:MAG TPA: phosphatidate cytidylyltransferase [Planctomycetota bacterium]|nr:phosphatidate cytidylyltransferase [Planctomycetota bacterium]
MLTDILLGLPYPAGIVGTLLIAAAAHEFYAMAGAAGAAPFAFWGVLAAAAAFNLPWMAAQWPCLGGSEGILAALAIATFIGLGVRFRKSRPNALADAAVTIFGAVYIGVFGGFIVAIHTLPQGAKMVLFFVAVSKAADIGGYLTGRFFGRRKLAPSISPNKTIEGSIGGVLLSLAAAFGLRAAMPGLGFDAGWAVLFAVLVNVASQFGDLAESMIKRGCGVKDSAVILPKVCGALDLIDSILLSAPVAYYLIRLQVPV